MRNPWILSILLVFILLVVPIFPRTWWGAAGLAVGSITLGSAFAGIHRIIRRRSQGKRSREIALGVLFLPMIGGLMIVFAIVAGMVVGAFSGIGAFQESVSQVNPNDPVAQGNAPLLAVPSFFEGGLAGLSVFWFGLLGGCLSSLSAFVYALVFPWLMDWAEKNPRVKMQ